MLILPFLGGSLMATLGQYETVILAAQRSAQLHKGAKPRVDTRNVKPTSVAVEEVLAGKVAYHEVQPQANEEEEGEEVEGKKEDKK